jgi:hypothetical protein
MEEVQDEESPCLLYKSTLALADVYEKVTFEDDDAAS